MTVRVLQGDCRDVLKTLPDESVHCVVTSPPYFGLRDYGVDGQIGLEKMPADYVSELVSVFSEARRVLRADGTVWLNLGDSYCTRSVRRDDGMRTVIKAYETSDEEVGFENWSDYAERGRAKYSSHFAHLGLKDKDLFGIPWMVAFALRAAGWYLRQDIIWSKPNPMPESVRDRCTKAHEYLFLLAKSERYYFDADAISEPATGWNGSTFDGERDLTVRPTTGRGPRNRRQGEPSRHGLTGAASHGISDVGEGRETRNKRSVWEVTTQPFKEAHFATFPPALIEPCILAGCPEGGTVLDPFGGAGTTGLVSDRHKRSAILIELNPEYAEMARKRIYNDAPLFADVA